MQDVAVQVCGAKICQGLSERGLDLLRDWISRVVRQWLGKILTTNRSIPEKRLEL
jgi:hypothetical protein